MSMQEEIQKYVSSARASGLDDATIKNNLVTVGWAPGDVDAALGNKAPGVPVPQESKQAAAAIQGNEKVTLFNPSHYAVIGFFFGVAPLIIGTLTNASRMQRPEWRKPAFAFGAVYVVSLAVQFGALIAMRNGAFNLAFIGGASIQPIVNVVLAISYTLVALRGEGRFIKGLAAEGKVKFRHWILLVLLGFGWTFLINFVRIGITG